MICLKWIVGRLNTFHSRFYFFPIGPPRIIDRLLLMIVWYTISFFALPYIDIQGFPMGPCIQPPLPLLLPSILYNYCLVITILS